MDLTDPIVLPRSPVDPLDSDLSEIDAAIALVRTGLATRVRLSGLRRPDRAAAAALARSQAAGVHFSVDRPHGSAVFTIGPTD